MIMRTSSLGVGTMGSGFNARFHLQAFRAVREADVRGVWSPNAKNAASAAALARQLDVGDAKPYESITAMIADPAIEALWLTGPNHARLENIEEIVQAVESGKGTIEFETCDGHTVIGEATTSWSFVGAGLRLSAELLGPEYSMSWNTLDTGLKLFFSRAVIGQSGEDLIEKQNAESELMPVVAGEAGRLWV